MQVVSEHLIYINHFKFSFNFFLRFLFTNLQKLQYNYIISFLLLTVSPLLPPPSLSNS